MLDQIQPLIKESVVRNHTAGSTIIYQGEVPRMACILLKGVVKVFTISVDGDDQIVTYHTGGEFFPSSWIFGKSSSALFFYEAETDCEVAFIPRERLIEFMLSDKERMTSMLDYFTTSYAAMLIRVNALEQAKARDKLVHTLYYLCQRHGTVSGSIFKIPLSLTHQKIASLVGLTRETTANEMSKLKQQGIISYKQQHYTINVDKLLELVGEESFKDIKIN